MSDETPNQQPPTWFQFESKTPELDLRDHLFYLGLNLDVDAQLVAIQHLLYRNQTADEGLVREIREIEEHAKTVSGRLNDRAVDEWMSRLHASVYQDAAHSMAAVGMLAPLMESIFCQCFQGIGAKFFPSVGPVTSHDRWIAAHTAQWNCRFVIQNGQMRTDLVKGIEQLADALGMSQRLPQDLRKTLSALFAYRNKMFHLGFEWPLAERRAFAARITTEGWPTDWFSQASHGDEPWIFYMSSVFIDHLLATIDGVLDGFAIYVRDDLLPRFPLGGQEA